MLTGCGRNVTEANPPSSSVTVMSYRADGEKATTVLPVQQRRCTAAVQDGPERPELGLPERRRDRVGGSEGDCEGARL